MLKNLYSSIFFKNPYLNLLTKFRYSAAKQTPTQNQKQQYRKALNQEQDQKQPQFQKQDRTTTGWILYRFFFWGSVSILSYNLYLVSNHEKDSPVQNETGAVPGFIGAAKFLYGKYTSSTEFLTKPPVNKLLADVIHPLMHPKTLVLNISGTLLDHDFVFGKGVNIKRRPGLNQFLKKMSQMYEIVIFSDDDSIFIESVMPSLDPRQQMISGFFGRQCMVLSRGRYIKDLKYLNRDLKNVIVIDKNTKTVTKHKQNVIVISQYHGDQNDGQLTKLGMLLQQLAKPEVKDVRKTIPKLGQNPLQKFSLLLKQKQQKIKNNKSSKIFDIFNKKN